MGSLPGWDRQDTMEGKPHGWIQWKGTNVCMDVHCECGFHGHIDDEFTYYVQCPRCGKGYMCNGHIQLVPLTDEENEEASKLNTYHVLHDDKAIDPFVKGSVPIMIGDIGRQNGKSHLMLKAIQQALKEGPSLEELLKEAGAGLFDDVDRAGVKVLVTGPDSDMPIVRRIIAEAGMAPWPTESFGPSHALAYSGIVEKIQEALKYASPESLDVKKPANKGLRDFLERGRKGRR